MATKTPHSDAYLKSEVLGASKLVDKELAKIQTFVLVPLISLLELCNSLKTAEVNATVPTVTQLIGNASARVSKLVREKAASSLNKALLPTTHTKKTNLHPFILVQGTFMSVEDMMSVIDTEIVITLNLLKMYQLY